MFRQKEVLSIGVCAVVLALFDKGLTLVALAASAAVFVTELLLGLIR